MLRIGIQMLYDDDDFYDVVDELKSEIKKEWR